MIYDPHWEIKNLVKSSLKVNNYNGKHIKNISIFINHICI